MPPAPGHLPGPTTLHHAFNATRPLEWGPDPITTADLTRLHGAHATTQSLALLEAAVAVEPAVTSQFLDSLPSGTAPYMLDRRVKSPESLARKLVDWKDSGARDPIDDLLRYTVLTQSPDDLVAAARRTVDSLGDHGWRVRNAMHSYTEGSRYKGLHVILRVPGVPHVEVQFHSAASAQVKEVTTPWYEVERSKTATTEERAAARQFCVEASAPLKPPAGIDRLTRLGGKRVAVNNYSDSRESVVRRAPRGAQQTSSHTPTLGRNDGIAR